MIAVSILHLADHAKPWHGCCVPDPVNCAVPAEYCRNKEIGDSIDVKPKQEGIIMADNKEVQKFVLRLPTDEHEGLKIMASVTGQSMNDLVVRAIREFLAGSGKREEFEKILTKVGDRHRLVLDKLAHL